MKVIWKPWNMWYLREREKSENLRKSQCPVKPIWKKWSIEKQVEYENLFNYWAKKTIQ